MSEFDEGPYLDALFQRRVVRVDDMRRETRWPKFAPPAAALGALGMLAFPMFVKDDGLCALKLYADQADAFTDESEHVGGLLAAHAAVAYSGALREENLLAALETLVRLRRQSNRKLRDVATELIRDSEAGASR